jgi:hypothetical protein
LPVERFLTATAAFSDKRSARIPPFFLFKNKNTGGLPVAQ